MQGAEQCSGTDEHEGFHLAVVGRLHTSWRQIIYKLIKIIFITRYMPARFKRMSRIPIPKPGRPDESRPISLCDDVFCFVNDVMAHYTSQQMEQEKILPDGIPSYRKGKGCNLLVATGLSIREDSLDSRHPTSFMRRMTRSFSIGYPSKSLWQRIV